MRVHGCHVYFLFRNAGGSFARGHNSNRASYMSGAPKTAHHLHSSNSLHITHNTTQMYVYCADYRVVTLVVSRVCGGSLHGRMRPAQASPLQQRGADVMARRTLPLVFRDSSPFLLSARCSPPLLAETNLGVSARWSCSTASELSAAPEAAAPLLQRRLVLTLCSVSALLGSRRAKSS